MGEVSKVSGKTEKKVLLVSAVVLLLAFFSTSFTGYHHAGVGAEGKIYDCKDYYAAMSFLGMNKRLGAYDPNRNGVVDEDDLEIIKGMALNRPCGLPSECSEEGKTQCSEDQYAVNLCIRDEFGRLVLESVPCDIKGMRCDTKRLSRYETAASCVYPFRNA